MLVADIEASMNHEQKHDLEFLRALKWGEFRKYCKTQNIGDRRLTRAEYMDALELDNKGMYVNPNINNESNATDGAEVAVSGFVEIDDGDHGDQSNTVEIITDSSIINRTLAEEGISSVNILSCPKTSDYHDVQTVVDECNSIFMGYGRARYTDDNPHCIEFDSKNNGRLDVTIHQPRKTILAFARKYAQNKKASKEDTGDLKRIFEVNPNTGGININQQGLRGGLYNG